MSKQGASRVNEDAALRLDKWLWFSRFFKTRSQAIDAVTGGLVHLNGLRVKPARDVQIGDVVSITREKIRIEVIIDELPIRRGPAPEAQAAYTETAESIAERARKQEQFRHAPPAPFGRPDKHERRALRDLRGR